MLFAIFALALTAPPEITVKMDAQRNSILGHVKTSLASVVAFEQFVRTRFEGYTLLPKTGLLITSADASAEDGFHAVTVLGVYRDSPGTEAGVLPGDRIIRLDGRRLEHEPTNMVMSLLDDKSGPVSLALKRKGKSFIVTLYPRPLPCLAIAAGKLDTSAWLERLSKMHELLDAANIQLETEAFTNLEPEDRQPALDATQTGLDTIAAVLPRLKDIVGRDLHTATMTSCQPVLQ